MPLDASIILGSAPLQQPKNYLKEALEIRSQRQQVDANALALQQQQLAYQQQQKAIADEAATRKYFQDPSHAKATDEEVIGALGPRALPILKDRRDTRKADVELQNTINEGQAKLLDYRGALAMGLSGGPLDENSVTTAANRSAYAGDKQGAIQLVQAFRQGGPDAVKPLIQAAMQSSPAIQKKLYDDAQLAVSQGNLKVAQENSANTKAHQERTDAQAARGNDIQQTHFANVDNATMFHNNIEQKKYNLAAEKQRAESAPILQAAGGDILSTLSPQDQEASRLLASGKMSMSTLSRKYKNPDRIIAGAVQMNPDFSAETYNVRDEFYNPGKKTAQKIRSLNAIAGHLGSAIQNSNAAGFAPMYAAGKEGYSPSKDGSALATDTNAIADELEVLLRAGGAGSESGVHRWISMLRSPANGNRQTALKEIGHLVNKQYGAINQQYQSAFKSDVPDELVTDEARDWLTRMNAPEQAPRQQAQASSTQISGARVKLVAPTGETLDVPESQVSHYLSKGAKRAK